eukprot:s15011_g1.t2
MVSVCESAAIGVVAEELQALAPLHRAETLGRSTARQARLAAVLLQAPAPLHPVAAAAPPPARRVAVLLQQVTALVQIPGMQEACAAFEGSDDSSQ